MNETTHSASRDEDESLGQLLREVGARDVPSTAAMNEVRQAVHAEWRSVAVQRQRRNWFVGTGIAAGIAAVAVAVTVSLRFVSGPVEPIAAVARVEGVLEVAVNGGGEWRPLPAGSPLTKGVMLRTDEGTRAALNLDHGISLRIDADSLVTLKGADHIALNSGAVYVDVDPRTRMNPQAVSPTLVIETTYGSVRHFGTQYEVRALRNGIEVSVREGRVEIANANHRHEGAVGEQLLIGREGVTARATVSPQDARWQWATNIAPAFDIERQPLSQFLEWVARETGKHLAYTSPAVRARAEQLILRGSVGDLAPEQALVAVLATTPFKQSGSQSTIRIQL